MHALCTIVHRAVKTSTHHGLNHLVREIIHFISLIPIILLSLLSHLNPQMSRGHFLSHQFHRPPLLHGIKLARGAFENARLKTRYKGSFTADAALHCDARNATNSA